MSYQPLVFDFIEGKVRRDHPDTSYEAAARVTSIETKRARVLKYVTHYGGATDEEIQDGLGMRANTERPRRVELVERGLIVDSGERRKTSSGRKAIVWKAT